jgi:hypothetical protein
MSKRSRRKREKRSEMSNRELNVIIRKIQRTKQPNAKQERAQTAKNGKGVHVHDVSADETPKVIKRKSGPLTLADKAKLAVSRRREREQSYVAKVEAKKQTPIRREIAMPQELSVLMAPPLPPRKKGDKPNIISLVYAFRAFQQFSHSWTRRRVSDPVAREAHYQEMKKRFRKAMEDAGLAEQFDWSDF